MTAKEWAEEFSKSPPDNEVSFEIVNLNEKGNITFEPHSTTFIHDGSRVYNSRISLENRSRNSRIRIELSTEKTGRKDHHKNTEGILPG